MKRGVLITIICLSLVFVMSLQFINAGSCVSGPFNTTHYCDISRDFQELKQGQCEGTGCSDYITPSTCEADVDCNWEYPNCTNNYECLSGSCDDGICKSYYQDIKEHTGFLEKFFNITYFIEKIRDFFSPGVGGELNCIDEDEDGYGSPASFVCTYPELDCNDTEASINPGATEICDYVDNNCDGLIDEGCTCTPPDTQLCGTTDEGLCEFGNQTCQQDGTWSNICGGDYVGPTAEICDYVDNNCDGFVDEGGVCDDVTPPEVEITSFPSKPAYYANEDIEFTANITDDIGGMVWSLSSDKTGEITPSQPTSKIILGIGGEEITFTFKVQGSDEAVNNKFTHTLTLEVEDDGGNTNSAYFDLIIENENCTDGIDNDRDGIYDGLDTDCTGSKATPLSIIDVSAKRETFTHRKININCEYETTSQSDESIEKCIKLTLEDAVMACRSKTVDMISNTVRFRDCDVGGQEKPHAEIKCFVDENKCNSQSPTYNDSAINITKFSICEDEEDVGEENLILYLEEPGNNDAFDPEDEINIELEVANNDGAARDLPIIVEAWLYNVDEESILGEVVSEAVTIDYPIEETFELMITVPDLEFSENNRLYYKAYVEGDEDEICISNSISLELQEAYCTDDDEDGYCEENENDCDDDDENVNPGVNESLYCTDGIDNDCDGLIDEDDPDCVIPSDQIIVILTGKSNNAGALTTRGVRRIMHPASRLDFKIATVSHSALAKNITSNSVTLTISSAPFDVSLATRQTKDVDTDRDGTEDLMITLEGIVNGAADITFRSIYTAPPGDGDGDRDGDEDEEEDGIGIGWIIFIFVLIIGIAVVVALIYLRKKREGVGLRPRRPPGPTGFASRRPRPPPRPAPMRPAPPRYFPPR